MWNNSTTAAGWLLVKFYIGRGILKSIEKTEVLLKMDKIRRQFTWSVVSSGTVIATNGNVQSTLDIVPLPHS